MKTLLALFIGLSFAFGCPPSLKDLLPATGTLNRITGNTDAQNKCLANILKFSPYESFRQSSENYCSNKCALELSNERNEFWSSKALMSKFQLEAQRVERNEIMRSIRSSFFKLPTLINSLETYFSRGILDEKDLLEVRSCNFDFLLKSIEKSRETPGCNKDVFDKNFNDMFQAKSVDKFFSELKNDYGQMSINNIPDTKKNSLCIPYKAYQELTLPAPYSKNLVTGEWLKRYSDKPSEVKKSGLWEKLKVNGNEVVTYDGEGLNPNWKEELNESKGEEFVRSEIFEKSPVYYLIEKDRLTKREFTKYLYSNSKTCRSKDDCNLGVHESNKLLDGFLKTEIGKKKILSSMNNICEKFNLSSRDNRSSVSIAGGYESGVVKDILCKDKFPKLSSESYLYKVLPKVQLPNDQSLKQAILAKSITDKICFKGETGELLPAKSSRESIQFKKGFMFGNDQKSIIEKLREGDDSIYSKVNQIACNKAMPECLPINKKECTDTTYMKTKLNSFLKNKLPLELRFMLEWNSYGDFGIQNHLVLNDLVTKDSVKKELGVEVKSDEEAVLLVFEMLKIHSNLGGGALITKKEFESLAQSNISQEKKEVIAKNLKDHFARPYKRKIDPSILKGETGENSNDSYLSNYLVHGNSDDKDQLDSIRNDKNRDPRDVKEYYSRRFPQNTNQAKPAINVTQVNTRKPSSYKLSEQNKEPVKENINVPKPIVTSVDGPEVKLSEVSHRKDAQRVETIVENNESHESDKELEAIIEEAFFRGMNVQKKKNRKQTERYNKLVGSLKNKISNNEKHLNQLEDKPREIHRVAKATNNLNEVFKDRSIKQSFSNNQNTRKQITVRPSVIDHVAAEIDKKHPSSIKSSKVSRVGRPLGKNSKGHRSGSLKKLPKGAKGSKRGVASNDGVEIESGDSKDRFNYSNEYIVLNEDIKKIFGDKRTFFIKNGRVGKRTFILFKFEGVYFLAEYDFRFFDGVDKKGFSSLKARNEFILHIKKLKKEGRNSELKEAADKVVPVLVREQCGYEIYEGDAFVGECIPEEEIKSIYKVIVRL